ncbi:MAG: hypothetical protein JXM72_12790 [Deltaproteobacteria bacterium]|nr:hypothetical protein [Deltaproteobacteria bacterium]
MQNKQQPQQQPSTEQKLRTKINSLYTLIGEQTEEIEVLKDAVRDFEHRLMSLAAQYEKQRVENDRLRAVLK